MATYAATDFHGMYNLWKMIKNYLKPKDTLYFLGDAIDRGSRGFEIFMELLNDPRVKYIKGNHEDLMLETFTSSGLAATQCFKQWRKNGGQETLDNIQHLGLTYDEKMEYVLKIREMPTSELYVNEKNEFFYLTHAGMTPSPEYFNMNIWDREYYDIWNRKHFLEKWDEKYPNTYVIHGHTPVQILSKTVGLGDNYSGFPLIYCDGHKIDLDSATFVSNMVTLYNLDKNKIEMVFKGE